ncbi:MAG: DMT family transporter [Candidatus Riflebacteria bacterium]|nr:DMT family transporter [Candidatus Riflebacteria bacterium]
MDSRSWRADALLLLTAVIWGAAFVAQRKGMDSVGPLTFNGIRFLLGALVLVPLARSRQRAAAETAATGGKAPETDLGAYLKPCGVAGVALFTGATMQQVGLVYTTAGKAGFITGLYVVLVPLLARFLGTKTSLGSWLGAGLAAAGLYLLSVNEDFSIAPGDTLVLIGAFFWANHVILVGRYAQRLEPVTFSIGQFAVCGMFSLTGALSQETITATGLRGALLPIAYGGLISVGIGYTLQVVAQKDSPPTHAAILLSLEAVFAAWTGRLLLGELMSWRATGGAAMMLAGCLLAQLWPAPTSPAPTSAAGSSPARAP